MHSLMERYDAVYQRITQFKEQIEEYEKQIQQIKGRRNDEIPARIANLKAQLEKIDDYELRIDGFMKLAEKHMTSKNVLTIEAPPGYRVNLNRLKTWSMMIDPTSEDDAYAQRVYLVSKCDLCFLAKKKKEFTERIAELEKDLANGSVDEIKELEKNIGDIRLKMEEYISGEEMQNFAQKVSEENEKNMYLEAPKTYSEPEKEPQYRALGAASSLLHTSTESEKSIKKLLGNFFDERHSSVFLPIESIPTNSEFAMTISCVPARRRLNEMDAGIRNLIFGMIDKSLAGSRKVYVIDAVRQNSSLVGSLKQLEGTFALHPVPRNAEQIQTTLEELLSTFNDIDDVLENCDTVAEYNATVSKDKQIPRSLVVIVGWPDAFEGVCNNYIKRIITNYERYGISFVIAKISAKSIGKEEFGLSEYVGENIIHISMNSKEATITMGSEEPRYFMWYPFKHSIGDDYVDSIQKHNVSKNQLGTEYIKRIDMNDVPVYTRGKKTLDIPYGIDSKDQIHNISFENENFAAYLMGASGSGKSTLLHTIITGIIRNYHPDDVELWLADFKMSEFAQYIDPLPPHVKYILLDESRELIYDLLDRLTEKMMERQRFFMQHKDMKKVENVPVNIYMPVIFVILDEFSIMSQVVSESEAYKLKLQNLLAKGRALGIKFIFSSQTFIRGIAGLTQTAKDQIQTRIAMKNSYDEINNTLELTSNIRTEQVKNWIDALPPHYVLSKYRDGDHMSVKRLQVMYFAGKGEEAFEPQRKLIRNLNSTLKPVSQDRYNGELNTYVDKHPVIVDGNNYKAFDGNKITQSRERDMDADSLFVNDVLLSMGDPRRMTDAKFVSVSNESRENMLVIARNAEQACCMSMILTAIKQCEQQNAQTHIWAYGRNRLYQYYKNSHFRELNVCEGIEEICDAIRMIKEKIENKVAGNELFVLIGMEQICSDFEIIDFTNTKKPKSMSDTNKFEAKSEEQVKALEEMHDIYGELENAIDEMMLDWMEKGKSNEEIQEEMKRMTAEFDKKLNRQSTADDVILQNNSSVQEAENAEDDREEGTGAYNALNDFIYIVTQGSRLGYHFMLCVNNYSDIAATRLKVSLFNHKFAFQISAEDSIALFGNKIASALPEHICQYSNSLEQFSFRPYLHKGVEWDGWEVDENGEVINPRIV